MYSGAIPVTKEKFSFLPVRIYMLMFLVLLPSFTAIGKELAPPSPDKPWLPPGLNSYEEQLTNKNTYANTEATDVQLNPTKVYDLPELIDIAQRSHPKTRVAWENAKLAAHAVGLIESAYYPYLAASAAAGFEHGPAPVLTVVAPASAAEEDAALNLEWLLFDFGERKAAVTAAKAQLMMANVGFNAIHQQIVFAVTKSFYAFNIAQQKVTVGESSLQAAQTVQEAAQARFDHGLATKTDLLQAEQQLAQAAYELDSAKGDLSDAKVALVDSLGILPSTELRVAQVPEKPFDEHFDESLDTLIDRALSQRPDLIAKLANVRASEAEVKQAQADFYPKISLGASAGWRKLDVNAYDKPYIGNSRPDYAVGINIQLPIFDGFLRANKLHMAQAKLHVAENELNDSRDTVVREVWKAYTDCKTAFHKQEFATKLLSAAQSAFDASLESYRQGLGTYVEVVNAQRNLAGARSVMVDTRAAIFTSQTALALSIGDLAKPSANSTQP